MNKEVIYLEPEDDITDILTKLQQAEQKLVALVPPKKATMLRSAVNMKLVARVAKECEKVVVVVTADPAIIKMAMMARIPVAKTLQSRPIVPTEENVKAAEALNEDIIDEDLEEKDAKSKKNAKIASKAPNSASETANAKSAATLDLTEESLENASKKAQDAKAKKKKAKNAANATSFIQKYRKLIVVGAAAVVVLIVALVWAFVFAPAVKITVAISSTPNNFSEPIHFTTDENAQNLEEGVFYAEQISIENTYKTDISASGEEDRGEKASGKLTVSVSFRPSDVLGEGYELSVPEGAKFTNLANNLTYIATDSKTKMWDGGSATIPCDNTPITISGDVSALRQSCTFSLLVDVEAEQAGSEYDIAASNRWDTYQGGSVSNGSPIAGGTTKMVKVISDEDVDKVKETQLAEHTLEGKEDVLADLSDDLIAIESSYKGEVVEVKTSPEKGQEVEDNDKPTAEVKITYSIYALRKTDVEEYIKLKLSLSDDQKIYSIGSPYIERFSGIENEARLKTTVETGPTVTEEDILEKVKGKKTGQVQSILRSINGVSSVNISTSYFWVWSVPDDPNRITIEMEVEDRS